MSLSYRFYTWVLLVTLLVNVSKAFSVMGSVRNFERDRKKEDPSHDPVRKAISSCCGRDGEEMAFTVRELHVVNGTCSLLDLLVMKWGAYPSRTQAKKACCFGSVFIATRKNNTLGSTCNHKPDWLSHQKLQRDIVGLLETLEADDVADADPKERVERRNSVIIRGQITSYVTADDVVFIVTRDDNCSHCYPVQVTKYIFPPTSSQKVTVVYQDNHLALVNKPENMTTIGENRDDLQSCLGFVLRPPSSLLENAGQFYLPRPVHRLDRRTSGLVLVAKTQLAMRTLSSAFAKRTVQKTYSALVFGQLYQNDYLLQSSQHQSARLLSSQSLDETNHEDSRQSLPNRTEWKHIDFPIEGKAAISRWRFFEGPRLVTTLEGQDSGPLPYDEKQVGLALLQVRPHSGRTHQIRRHLAYCLGLPIVGDAKYDKGSYVAKSLRDNGMYLCCHSLEFPYPFTNNKNNPTTVLETGIVGGSVRMFSDPQGQMRLHAEIPLPNKFLQRLEEQEHRADNMLNAR